VRAPSGPRLTLAFVASELRQERWGGIVVSHNGFWRCLCRRGLNTRITRLSLVAGTRRPTSRRAKPSRSGTSTTTRCRPVEFVEMAAPEEFQVVDYDGKVLRPATTGEVEHAPFRTMVSMQTWRGLRRQGQRRLPRSRAMVADSYPVLVALHTDHCPPAKADAFLRPLLEESLARVTRNEAPLYHSHMFDGSSLRLEVNLKMAAELLELCRHANVILEVQIDRVADANPQPID
jgi:hypothetical protein